MANPMDLASLALNLDERNRNVRVQQAALDESANNQAMKLSELVTNRRAAAQEQDAERIAVQNQAIGRLLSGASLIPDPSRRRELAGQAFGTLAEMGILGEDSIEQQNSILDLLSGDRGQEWAGLAAQTLGVDVAQPDSESFANPIAAVDEEGNDVFIRPGNQGSINRVEGYRPRPRDGQVVEITDADGRTTRIGSGSALSNSEISGGTRGSVEKEMVAYQDTMGALQRIGELFDPSLLEYETSIKTWGANFLEKMGQDVSPELRQEASRYNALRAQTNQTLSTIIKQLSGAAVNASEEARLRGFIPTMDDGPSQFQTKLDEFMETTRRAYMRRTYLLNNGLSVTPEALEKTDISLDSMPSRFNRRVEQILSKMQRMNPDKPRSELEQSALDEAMVEFGLQ